MRPTPFSLGGGRSTSKNPGCLPRWVCVLVPQHDPRPVRAPYGIGIACRRLPSRAVRRSVLRVFRLRRPPLPLRGLHGVAVPDTRY